jgi:hypothetical protein
MSPKLFTSHNHLRFFMHNEFCPVRLWLGVKGFVLGSDDGKHKAHVRI